jgi:uncharacterized LabA/DUF88 family protein
VKTAFFVDAGFYLRRLNKLHGPQTSTQVVDALLEMCESHLRLFQRDQKQLYRILVYDCPPIDKKAHYPISKKGFDWAKTETFRWKTRIHQELRGRRKVALRLGRLNDAHAAWVIQPDRLKELLNGKLEFSALKDDDFTYDVKQKGVDMRIGLDIASIATKRLVDQMVLVAGDSDFVPAAKMARREGIDFVLDPMGSDVPADLREHVDGVQSVITPTPKPPKPPADGQPAPPPPPAG